MKFLFSLSESSLFVKFVLLWFFPSDPQNYDQKTQRQPVSLSLSLFLHSFFIVSQSCGSTGASQTSERMAANLSTSQLSELSEMELSTSSLPSPTEEYILPLVLRQFSYADIKSDLTRCMAWSSRLCFFQSQRWAAELLRPMEKIKGKVKSPS